MKNNEPIHALNWFELPVTDFERAQKFYSTILDYQMPETMMGSYRMGFLPVKMGEGIGGAIVQGEGYVPNAHGALVYLNGGEDLRSILNRVENAGGKITLPKTNITPELGYFALFMDTEGNKVGLHSMN